MRLDYHETICIFVYDSEEERENHVIQMEDDGWKVVDYLGKQREKDDGRGLEWFAKFVWEHEEDEE